MVGFLFLCIFVQNWKFNDAFSAPGIIPPETFVAEKWYPSNLPTVQPPWKMPGADIFMFQTARPHQPPGSGPIKTTFSTVAASLPMPPGSKPDNFKIDSPRVTVIDEPHPPASQLSSNSTAVDKTTNEALDDDTLLVSVTATNIEKHSDKDVLKILSTDFEDITKVDNTTIENNDVDVIFLGNSTRKNEENEGSGDELNVFSSTESTMLAVLPNVNSSAETHVQTLIEKTTRTSIFNTTRDTTPALSATSKIITSLGKISATTISTTTASTTITTSISTATTTATSTTTLAETTSSQVFKKLEIPTAIEDISKPAKECKNILFVLDSSGNVIPQYEKQKKYIEEIVLELEKQSDRKYSLITYAGRSRQKIVVPISNEKNAEKFLVRLKKARFLQGVTATGSALSITTQYVLQKGKQVQVVIITDGFSFDDVFNQAEALRTLNGVETYVSGRYFPTVKNVLLDIAGKEDHIFFDKNERKLIDVLKC